MRLEGCAHPLTRAVGFRGQRRQVMRDGGVKPLVVQGPARSRHLSPYPHRLDVRLQDLLAVDLHIPCFLFFPARRLAIDFHRFASSKRAFGVHHRKTVVRNYMVKRT
jgi:hypothetical protein